MRNIISIIFLIFLMGAGGSVGVGFGSGQEKEGIGSSALREDEPVEAVRSFWWLSLRESPAAKDLIGAPPKSYFDKQCPNPVPVVASPGDVRDNWMRNSLIRLSTRVAKYQIPGESVQLISETDDEAVVSVSYFDPGRPESGRIVHYSFLYRIEGKWKLFMTIRDPIFYRTTYAGLNCNFHR